MFLNHVDLQSFIFQSFCNKTSQNIKSPKKYLRDIRTHRLFAFHFLRLWNCVENCVRFSKENSLVENPSFVCWVINTVLIKVEACLKEFFSDIKLKQVFLSRFLIQRKLILELGNRNMKSQKIDGSNRHFAAFKLDFRRNIPNKEKWKNKIHW
jgi:hypothetical protein